MKHYICTGECKGASDKPGVCQTKDCPKHGRPLKELHPCPECGMHYLEKEIAKKCEDWCKKYKSCNVELIKLAVENK